MATTSHGLSVYVNSCVKNPVNSRTRTASTFAERRAKESRLAFTDPGPLAVTSDDFTEENGGDLLGSSLPVPPTAAQEEELRLNLTDEAFYLKLQQLKEANRRTLEECERLYRQQHGGAEEDGGVGSATAREMVEQMFAARLAERSGHASAASSTRDMTATSNINNSSASRGPVSSKPPRAPGGLRGSQTFSKGPVRTSGTASMSVSSQSRLKAAARAGEDGPRRAYSLDDEDWRAAMCDSSDLSDDEVRSDGPLDPEMMDKVTRIRDMWRGFKIDDYNTQTEPKQRPSSASERGRKKQADLEDSWRHRITVPQPFRMSLREEQRPKKKTRAQEELERKRLERQLQEEEECQKKFKAQPAPAHIYLPLYDELQEKNETRRRVVKATSKDTLRSQEKPFNFTRREEEKKTQRTKSATIADRIARSAEQAKQKEAKFKARPVPTFVYDSTPTEKLQEDEEYRKIRIKMRAKELLKESSLPPNMAMHEKLKQQREKEKLLKAKQKARSKKGRAGQRAVPDYDFLFHQFQKELARRKHNRDPTVVEPFELETNRLRSRSRERVIRDMERDEKLMREATKTPHPLGHLSSSMDAIPFRSSVSSDLRTSQQRLQQERELRRLREQEEDERRRAAREVKLRKYILERGDNTPRVDDQIKERLKRHRQAEISRLEQYERELEEMKAKLDKRPLLFERETQLSAGKAAEKKFKSTLRSAGVDEDFVHTRSSLGDSRAYQSGDSDGEWDTKGDTTFTKSRVAFEDEA